MASNKAVVVKSPRKLIEVALPLDKINAAAAREKSIRHGHPSTLHLWWARRPLAAARAVLFAQLVNDPGYERHLNRGVNKIEAAKERERLFKIIEDLVIWENTNKEQVLSAARSEIWRSWRETCELNRNHSEASVLFDPNSLPAFHDPFAGGGAIPLEAQRLGLESYASDLNPVAVTINKAMIEIPQLFAGRVPIGPIPEGEHDLSLLRTDWPGASGLAEDVRRYGLWLRAQALSRIGHLYPQIEVTAEMAQRRPDLDPVMGQSLTVIAWIWARTVKSPNPAYSQIDVPLVSTFVLSSKAGKEAYVEPVLTAAGYEFTVKVGKAPQNLVNGTKLSRGANFECLVSKTAIEPAHVYGEAQAKRMGTRLMAIVAEGPSGRVFLEPSPTHEEVARLCKPAWQPDLPMSENPRWFSPPMYGLTTYGDLFTQRQLVTLNTLSELVAEVNEKCLSEGIAAGLSPERTSISDGGDGAWAYAQGITTYLAFLVDQVANHGSSICGWNNPNTQMRSVFSRQAIPMTWDFAEANVFSGSSGSFDNLFERQVQGFEALGYGESRGIALQANAADQTVSLAKIISTDPPYYDNIGYADLSDFFYVWLRKNLRSTYPSLFQTLAVPKGEELVATPYRHGGKTKAETFFLDGMTSAMHSLSVQSHPAFPVTIYYAFKQSDTDESDTTSNSGWQTFIAAVIRSGFAITGTWPMRTEKQGRSIGNGTNSLASSIILVCRKRDDSAITVSRREFLRELQAVLPDALIDMTRGGVNSPVAPVDLSQAIIGPGMGIFSKYKAVLEADGQPMSVRTALQLINRFLADDEFDGETQFCLQWLESYDWKAAEYGPADTLAQAKGAILAQMNREGLLTSGAGLVQLVRWQDLNTDWLPEQGNLTPIWQALHQLIANLQAHGEQSTGTLLAAMPAVSGRVRTLAYRLYTLAERKGQSEDARPYNELIGAWSAIELAAAEAGPIETQAELF
jgi:putative DNA methylase